jgi:hypothetical protein
MLMLSSRLKQRTVASLVEEANRKIRMPIVTNNAALGSDLAAQGAAAPCIFSSGVYDLFTPMLCIAALCPIILAFSGLLIILQTLFSSLIYISLVI